MAASEGRCNQNVHISLVLSILFDSLFSRQIENNSKELLYLKNAILTNSIFDNTSNKKTTFFFVQPQIQASIQICMFQQTSMSVAPNALYQPPQCYQRCQPYERYSHPILDDEPKEQGQSRRVFYYYYYYYYCIWSPMNRDSWLSLFQPYASTRKHIMKNATLKIYEF